MRLLVALCMLFVVVAAAPTQSCPPPGFDSVRPFNVSRYTGQWYSIEQQPVIYLPRRLNYCTNARYVLLDDDKIAVFNGARVGSVNGPLKSVELRAVIPESSDPSKILVGPVWLPPFMYGPYWVVAVGGGNDTAPYEWAVISGGPPTIPSNGACRTRYHTVNGSGLWLFHRNATPPAETVDMLRDKAKSLGFDISVLNTVDHRGCNYTDH